MAEILSQSQIDELLNNLNSGDIDIKEIDTQEKKVKEYDFRSPKKITKETIKLLKGIYENYCRFLSSRLTSILRLSCDITVEQVEESIFHEYNNALNDYVLMSTINIIYSDGVMSESQMFMEVSMPLSFVIIDRLLGGSGQEYEHIRDYTDIELTLLGNLFKQIIPQMESSWESTADIKTEFAKVETNPRFIQSVNYTDTVVILVLSVTLNHLAGKITVCIPSGILDEISKKASLRNNKKKLEPNFESQKKSIMDSIKASKLTVTGILGKSHATLGDLLNMQIGDVIILDKGINQNIDINVDGEKWFEGKWGTKKNKGVVKINKIIH